MPLEPGTEVQHKQWGRGTVLFDKPHCIGIRFLEHGQVNFTQEEWASGRSPASRFRTLSDLEYNLERAVQDGDMTEEQAAQLLERKVHPMELRRMLMPAINDAYEIWRAGKISEDEFYSVVLNFIERLVKTRSPDAATFSNIQDSITDSAVEFWQRIAEFDPARGSMATYITTIVVSNIRDRMRKYKTSRGGYRHVDLEDQILPSRYLDAEHKLLFDDWLKHLEDTDRSIVVMTRDGLRQSEIAEALGISQPAVAQRLQRLRQQRPPF